MEQSDPRGPMPPHPERTPQEIAGFVVELAAQGMFIPELPDEVLDVLNEDLTKREGHWQQRALCQFSDPELFFPDNGAFSPEAVRFCLRCTVQPECLDEVLESSDKGTWGGQSERQITRLRKTE